MNLSELRSTKSCIIFACTILTDDRLFVLDELLTSFKNNFADADIYIGINPGSIDAVETVIEGYGLNTITARAPIDLYTLSDASAYQVALQLAKDSANTYDSYWFVHTKGGVNSYSDYLRYWYINNLLDERSNVEAFLTSNPDFGSYGLLGTEANQTNISETNQTDVELLIFSGNCTEQLPCTRINFFYIHSIYVIKGEIIDKFFSLVTNKWFNSKLDRYYFEGVFYFIVSRLGYFPYLDNRTSMNGIDLKKCLEVWINENNLISYNKYLDLYSRNYAFHQKTPPNLYKIDNTLINKIK
jgi:hypothetical protein